jgi:hypothetical protein
VLIVGALVGASLYERVFHLARQRSEFATSEQISAAGDAV